MYPSPCCPGRYTGSNWTTNTIGTAEKAPRDYNTVGNKSVDFTSRRTKFPGVCLELCLSFGYVTVAVTVTCSQEIMQHRIGTKKPGGLRLEHDWHLLLYVWVM